MVSSTVWLVKKKILAGKSVDHTLAHAWGENLILATRLNLFIGFLTAQVALARFAVSNFTGAGDLKSFSYSFMRLSHDEIWEKDDL